MKTRIVRFQGFTLIELLAVIAIIMVLMSLLIPALSWGNYKGKTISCMNAKDEVNKVFMSYAGDNQGRYPNDHNGWLIMNPHDIEWTMIQKFVNWGGKITWINCQLAPQDVFDATTSGYLDRAANPPSNEKWILYSCEYWVMRGGGGPCSYANGYNLTDVASGHPASYAVFSDLIEGDNLNSLATYHLYNGQFFETAEVFGDGHVRMVPAAEIQPRYSGGWSPWWWLNSRAVLALFVRDFHRVEKQDA